jgi:hypothetical protein
VSARRLVLWWVGVYTRGLPTDTRCERLREIDSDVWEHLSSAGAGTLTELSILSRCLRGLPADVAWRRRARLRRSRRLPWARMPRALGWSMATCSYVLVVLAHGIASTPLVGLDLVGGDPDDVMRTACSGVVLLALLLSGLGLLLRGRRSGVGAALLVAGAMGTPLAYSWAAILFGPLGLAVSAGALTALARRQATEEA